jgi:hypothetical protein
MMNDTMHLMRLEQFAWLIENFKKARAHPMALQVLWDRAEQMARFQLQANCTDKPVEFFERGEVLRTLYPEGGA